MTRNLDSTRSPMAFLGAELRRARVAAGMSQEQLGREINFSGDMVGKVETTDRAPTPAFAAGCDRVFPQFEGLFSRLVELARRWDGPYPQWFRDWVEAEQEATSLRAWQPLLVPGLLQTEGYARAILAAGPDSDPERIEQMVAARLDRQAVLGKPDPPALWAVLDEGVLHRPIGSPEVMREQLAHLAEIGRRPLVTIQVVPARNGAHAGLLGAFTIGGFASSPDIVFLETSAGGQVIENPRVVAWVTLRYDIVRAAALPRDDSRDLIVKVAKDRWTRT